ncbi:FHA domain-containing protein [Crocosphaera sp. XPORK-15E]|uniref:FHA domain-containing protein n=1 Tax=Crocosphaera sp. XPORK-15E TaxID=3110247 RepID=UPI002B200491|nr:FHA domain-containing protein [Crocosphaera sp. XPORK-15E]MEA5536616.1 FHA domain-containing protein [Crocosphaera sp. XPORK-15E]
MGHQHSSQGVLILVIEGEIQPDATYPLSNDLEILIGRDSTCDIPLDFDTNISRRHASIRPLKGGGWEIVDHNSSNGTYINGNRLQGTQILHPGDHLIFSQGGPEFVFEYQVPVGIAVEKNQSEAVAPRQTIETQQYCLEILPRQLIINTIIGNNRQKQREFWWNVAGKLVGGIILFFLIYALWSSINLFPFNIIIAIIIMTIFFYAPVTSYQFDLDTQKLTITSQSFVDSLFNHYRYQFYPLEEFTAVRLQKSVYEGDSGTQYNDFNIELVREDNKSLRLAFTWRQYLNSNLFQFLSGSSRDAEKAQLVYNATQLIDWIQKYLEHE